MFLSLLPISKFTFYSSIFKMNRVLLDYWLTQRTSPRDCDGLQSARTKSSVGDIIYYATYGSTTAIGLCLLASFVIFFFFFRHLCSLVALYLMRRPIQKKREKNIYIYIYIYICIYDTLIDCCVKILFLTSYFSHFILYCLRGAKIIFFVSTVRCSTMIEGVLYLQAKSKRNVYSTYLLRLFFSFISKFIMTQAMMISSIDNYTRCVCVCM